MRLVILASLMFVSFGCARPERAYFGVVGSQFATPFLEVFRFPGFYEGGRFVVNAGQTHIRAFPLWKRFPGVTADGHRQDVVIERTGLPGWAALGYSRPERIRDPDTGSAPQKTLLIWTPNIQLEFPKTMDATLDEQSLKVLRQRAPFLYQRALSLREKEFPLDRKIREVETLAPRVTRVDGINDVVTVTFNFLLDRDPRASAFFVYSIGERRVLFETFGHPEWISEGEGVVTGRPWVYFRIKGAPTVYSWATRFSGMGEETEYYLFNLRAGKIVTSVCACWLGTDVP